MQERPSPTPEDPQRRLRRRRWRIAALAVATAVLFGLLFVQAAFNTLEWIRPSSVRDTFGLYALSTINFLAFIVLLMVLVRNVIKLRHEQLERKVGARFKTRIVIFFLALSLLPVTFLFFMTTGLINRSIDKWFSLPGNEMLTNAWQIQNAYVEGERQGLDHLAKTLARLMTNVPPEQLTGALLQEVETQDLIAAALYDADGNPRAERFTAEARGLGAPFREALDQMRNKALGGQADSAQLSGERGASIWLISSAAMPAPPGGALVIARQIPQNLVGSVSKIREFKSQYEALQESRKQYRSTQLQTLSLITLLVLFIAFWLAIYVARSVTDPVRQLAIATERIKSGDLSYRADVIGDDELAALARSFNEMTEEVADHRARLEHLADELQHSNAALEERRRYIETILQSLSAGVISLDENASVTMINEAARQLLHIGTAPVSGMALEALLPEEEREQLRRMIARAAKLRTVAQEVHFTLANQTRLDAAVTVTALHDPAGEARGAVIVIEDLSELIEAQRRAAWSEVARRMAHEIKNPLTPIRLSAERLAKNLLGEPNGSGPEKRLDCLSDRHERLVRECTTMIGAEVATLQRMVDEFSNFARLPKANLEAASLNEVVEKTLRLYDERLEGIRLESHLDPRQPQVLIDADQIKRVLVNLIDNAAEALAGVEGDRRILVSTVENAAQETVDLVVADTGPGIPPEHRNRVFDPYFSTRKRGTGLGLAIVSRIVAEHQGRIRLQAQPPRGARFVIELPGGRSGESAEKTP